MSKLICSICVVLLLTSAAFSADPREEFRTQMLAKVGKSVTVSGKLVEGKDSPYVEVRDGGLQGGVHLKFDFDDKLMEKHVTATGILRYREKLKNPPGTSAVPEMFYFDKGTASLSPTKAP